MAESSFPTAQKHVLAYEGGYSNHPADPGGVTLNGIIQREYNRWRKKWGKAQKTLTRAMLGTAEWIAERDTIFKQGYWLPLRCPDLEPGVDGAAYDYGVNSGIGRSAKVLQRLVGVKEDGRVGPITVAAANKRDPEALALAICKEREAFLRRLSTFSTFGVGWIRRVNSVIAYTKVLAVNYKTKVETATPAPARVATEEPIAKGMIPEPKKTKAVVKASGPAAATEEAARSGTSWVDWISAHPAETALIAVVAVIVVVGVVMAISAWHKSRQETPMPGFGPLPEAAH